MKSQAMVKFDSLAGEEIRRSSTGWMRSPCQANKPGAVFLKTYSGLALRTGGSQGSPGSGDGGNYDGRVKKTWEKSIGRSGKPVIHITIDNYDETIMT